MPDALFGPFFVFVGLCWPLLAFIGYSMATVGLCGLALAFGGRRGMLWALAVNKMEEKIEKKTHLGPKRHQTRRLGPFSSSWAFVGRHWLLDGYCGPSWACIGLRWPSLAAVGFRGPALAFGGRRWLLWTFVVNKMEEKIEKKTHLGPKRRQTRRLGPFSSLWAFVGLCWPSLATQWLLWVFVGLHWPSLAVVGCCGHLWACVGCCGLLWACVGLRWLSLAAMGLRCQ